MATFRCTGAIRDAALGGHARAGALQAQRRSLGATRGTAAGVAVAILALFGSSAEAKPPQGGGVKAKSLPPGPTCPKDTIPIDALRDRICVRVLGVQYSGSLFLFPAPLWRNAFGEWVPFTRFSLGAAMDGESGPPAIGRVAFDPDTDRVGFPNVARVRYPDEAETRAAWEALQNSPPPDDRKEPGSAGEEGTLPEGEVAGGGRPCRPESITVGATGGVDPEIVWAAICGSEEGRWKSPAACSTPDEELARLDAKYCPAWLKEHAPKAKKAGSRSRSR